MRVVAAISPFAFAIWSRVLNILPAMPTACLPHFGILALHTSVRVSDPAVSMRVSLRPRLQHALGYSTGQRDDLAKEPFRAGMVRLAYAIGIGLDETFFCYRDFHSVAHSSIFLFILSVTDLTTDLIVVFGCSGFAAML